MFLNSGSKLGNFGGNFSKQTLFFNLKKDYGFRLLPEFLKVFTFATNSNIWYNFGKKTATLKNKPDMKRSTFYSLIIATFTVASTLILTSCAKEKIETMPLGTVNVNMFESLFNNGREFYLQVLTDQTNLPVSYYIRNAVTKEGTTITVDLIDIEKVDASGVNVATGSASAYINLGQLTAGQHTLKINVATNANAGILSVEDNFFVTVFDQTNGLTFNYDTLYRIPNGALWGYIGYQSASFQSIAESFKDTLQDIGAVGLGLTEGKYGYFWVDESGAYHQEIDENYTFYRQYFYSYIESKEALTDVIEYYDIRYSQVKIILYWVFEEEKKSALIKPEEISYP